MPKKGKGGVKAIATECKPASLATPTVNMDKDPRGLKAHRKRFGEEVVVLLVGEKERAFVVHKQLLLDNSPFFVASLTGDWREGRENRVPFPDDAPDILELYVQWLYESRIFTATLGGPERDSKEYETLIKAFIFGEKIQDGCFKDAVIDSIIAAANTPSAGGKIFCPGPDVVDLAFDGTPEDSPLRRVLLDLALYRGHKNWNIGTRIVYLQALVKGLLELRQQLPVPDPTKLSSNLCVYHHHAKEAECYTSRRNNSKP